MFLTSPPSKVISVPGTKQGALWDTIELKVVEPLIKYVSVSSTSNSINSKPVSVVATNSAESISIMNH